MANALREATKDRLYPFLASRGWKRVKSTHSHFVCLVRPQAQKTDFLLLQWDKYGRELFVLNLCE